MDAVDHIIKQSMVFVLQKYSKHFKMTRTNFLLSTLALSALATASASVDPTVVFQVEKGIELENIAIRSNGEILASGIGKPILYQFNPASDCEPSQLITIPEVTSLFGVAEISQDIFAIAAGNWTRGNTLIPGTFSTWSINFQSPKPTFSKILDFPRAAFLNGLTVIPPQSANENGTILVSDTATGQVYHVHPNTSKMETVLAVDSATNTTTTPCAPQAGINGMKFNANEQTLYYTNTMKAVFCKVSLAITYSTATDLPTITVNGPYTVIASRIPGDDFTVTSDGTAYIGANPINTVFKVTPAGNVTVLAGGMNETIVAGATSAAVGRTSLDENKLYVSTNGIFGSGANATSEGGKVVMLSLAEELPTTCS